MKLENVRNMEKMPFFVGVQIWSILFEGDSNLRQSDSNHPPLFQFFSLSRIEIRILSIGDSNPSSGCWISSTLSEVFALGIKYIFETLNNMISKHIRSVLVSLKSIRNQPWFNIGYISRDQAQILVKVCCAKHGVHQWRKHLAKPCFETLQQLRQATTH